MPDLVIVNLKKCEQGSTSLVTFAEGAVEVDEIFSGTAILGGRLVDLHQVYFSLAFCS